jgi:16S rRNA (uracil1498-N3)-methyltransferase
MEYFYTPPHLIKAHELTIDGDEFVHLTHVMRKKPGDAIRVVNGAGTAYDATIAEISKRTARCEITATHSRLNEPEIDVTLGVAILKNASKFDFLVEKVTELGVNTIVPLTTERTIPRHAKADRWQKLALAAMKQSCRCVLPTVRNLTRFEDFITSTSRHSHKLIPHEKAHALLATQQSRTSKYLTLCVGPEGGFSDVEIALAQQEGFLPVSLGPTRLRTETAAIAAMALILH